MTQRHTQREGERGRGKERVRGRCLCSLAVYSQVVGEYVPAHPKPLALRAMHPEPHKLLTTQAHPATITHTSRTHKEVSLHCRSAKSLLSHLGKPHKLPLRPLLCINRPHCGSPSAKSRHRPKGRGLARADRVNGSGDAQRLQRLRGAAVFWDGPLGERGGPPDGEEVMVVSAEGVYIPWEKRPHAHTTSPHREREREIA